MDCFAVGFGTCEIATRESAPTDGLVKRFRAAATPSIGETLLGASAICDADEETMGEERRELKLPEYVD
jgi:hypothetical protein